MATTEKALSLSRDLADVFAKELISACPYQTQSFDSNGNPTIALWADASETSTHNNVVITVKPFSTGTAKDVFGNTPAYSPYTPHIVQVMTESSTVTVTAATYVTPAVLLPLFAEIGKRGAMVEWHQTASGTVPTAATLVADTGAYASFKPLYFGVQSAI